MGKGLLPVAFIVTIGLAVWFACWSWGKEKAEANEPNDITIELVFDDPNDPNSIWYDYDPYPATITLYHQNGRELNIELGGGHELVCSGTKNEFYEVMYFCLSGKEPTEKVTLRFKKDRKLPEPNEPDLTIDIPDIPEHRWKCSCGEGFGDMFEVFCSCGKTYKTFDIIMKCVPTWPDYIELERDLFADGQKMFSKGTKIYFKDD